ncbi:MAG TPA: four helix bundle protein [Flavisolibacter sp.]|nr:four helix bundle protein [Flavisolibacter sp.]
MTSYKHFYDMPVYKTCRSFRKEVSNIVRKNFPKEERFLLSAQLLDAARSITANLAEGFGRFHYQENIQFCRQSRGSLAETMEHLITAYDEKYIDKTMLENVNSQYKQCLKELNGYIKYLKTVKAKPIINNE